MAELHVLVHARERRALGVDPGPVEVLLHEDLRDVVAHLRPHHPDRMVVRGVPRRNE